MLHIANREQNHKPGLQEALIGEAGSMLYMENSIELTILITRITIKNTIVHIVF